jgi:muramidase (phage lysozyme)
LNIFLFAAAAIASAVYLAARNNAGQALDSATVDTSNAYTVDPPAEGTDQQTTIAQDIAVSLDPTTYTPAAVPVDVAVTNKTAFLDMIAVSEGTSGPDGYRTLFGGGLFDSYADHPRKYFSFTNSKGQHLKTSAAGRYQFLISTWDDLARKLGLPDFSPESQDAAALELVRQRGAINDVEAGRLSLAVNKCAPIWASLPGAGYAQHENKYTTLLAAYQAAGGNLEA